MTFSAVPLLALLLSAPGSKVAKPEAPKVEGTKLEQGQKLLALGEIEAALKALDAAAAEGGDDATLEKVHLLRAQCFGARQDFLHAEEALAAALTANPEASLDPARIDPTLVKLLDAVRARLTGTLALNASPSAELSLDDKPLGPAPQTVQAPVGRHRVAAVWKEGEPAAVEVLVRPGREVSVEWVQGVRPAVAPPQPCPEPPALFPTRALRPFGDLRGVMEINARPGAFLTGGMEVGGGIEVWSVRLGLWARLFPHFGLTPRLAFALPLRPLLGVAIELGVPVLFLSNGVGIGLSGMGALEFSPVPWFALWAGVGARHYFQWPNLDPTAISVTGGVRLRLP